MTRTFPHSFDPPTASPTTDPTANLDVSDIEDTGIQEVLQTPGAAYGAWSILDVQLTSTGAGTPFIFREPLGQVRGQGRPVRCFRTHRRAPTWSVTSTCLSSPISAAEPSTWILANMSRSHACPQVIYPTGSAGEQFLQSPLLAMSADSI